MLKGVVGGVLDPAGQRALVAFDASSLDQTAAAGETVALDAATLSEPATGYTRAYFWDFPPTIPNFVLTGGGSLASFVVLCR